MRQMAMSVDTAGTAKATGECFRHSGWCRRICFCLPGRLLRTQFLLQLEHAMFSSDFELVLKEHGLSRLYHRRFPLGVVRLFARCCSCSPSGDLDVLIRRYYTIHHVEGVSLALKAECISAGDVWLHHRFSVGPRSLQKLVICHFLVLENIFHKVLSIFLNIDLISLMVL